MSVDSIFCLKLKIKFFKLEFITVHKRRNND